jgi:hypothetical protein
LHSNLRFVISASLVGCAGLIGVLALLPPTLEERLLASAELSAAPAPACNQHNWLRFDRNCLSRRGMPWVADLPAQKEDPSPIESAPAQAADTQTSAAVRAATETSASSSSAASASASTEGSASASTHASASASTETSASASTDASASASTDASTQVPASESSQSSMSAAQESTRATDVTASRQEAPVPAPIADAPQVATQQSEVPQQEPAASPLTGERRAVKQRSVTRHAAPPVATERRVAKPVVDSQPPAPKKPAREARGAKPSNEALNAVRKFQDNLRDIPVSSYAADGTQRTIVIRPTSIQDVYYYSAPR